MMDKVIAGVNALGHHQSQLLTFFNQNNREIGNKDETVPEDNSAKEMPGVVRTKLQMNDNMEKVDEDYIKITGVDPVETEDYPKTDLNIDLPPNQPQNSENPHFSVDNTNNESEPTYEPTNLGTTKTVIETPRTTPIVQAKKE